jgi:Ca-activated chloride channel family protein
VRIEELINYFRFAYRSRPSNQPFSVTTELSECPWNPKHRLALIGCRAASCRPAELPARNLVFLIDVSGSMMSADKLPLVRNAMRMLASRSPPTIASPSSFMRLERLVLPSTQAIRRAIDRAIAELEAGGSTNGGEGIRLAYKVAREHFIRGGVNRVVLATDGDFNVGTTSQDELVRLIEEQRASGVFLSVPRRRHRQSEGLDDGEARRQGQRQLRVSRLAARGAQGAAARGRRDARHRSRRT